MKKISDIFWWRKQERIRREILLMLAKGQKSGILDDASKKMIENILDFNSIMVREIMVPRTDIVCIDADDTTENMIREIIESRFTRIPVHRGSVDNIIGILNVKDLLKTWPEKMTAANVISNLSKPYYIPETKNAHLLFYEFKNNKKHIAIVIDEYGGTSGLVTFEDLLEEIVGDIRDEHEENSIFEDLIRNAEGEITIDGRTEIEKLEEVMNITLEPGRFETVSGLILYTIRRIPHSGESFQIAGMNITVESADERSIKKVRIIKSDNE